MISLKKLQQRKPNYLNDYDQLFRYVALWLLQQGYELTNHEPHQVLKCVCLLHCPNIDVQGLVRHHHQLKKCIIQQVDLKLWQELLLCLGTVKASL